MELVRFGERLELLVVQLQVEGGNCLVQMMLFGRPDDRRCDPGLLQDP